MTAELRAYARQKATQYGLPEWLLERQIDQESGFNPGVTSPAGAQGISQFMPGTAASVGLTNPFDPYASIDAQARLMSQYVRDYGSIENALIAYNWGPGNVGRSDLPPETQTYLSNILGGDTLRGRKQQASEVGVINALIASLVESQPQPGDFTDQMQGDTVVYSAAEQYQEALYGWMSTMESAISLKQSFAEEEAGMFRMDDGTIVTRDMMDQLDPAARAQVEATIANKNIERQNAYNQLVNDLSLTEFQVGQQSAGMENQRRSQDFQNQMESYREGLGLDVLNQDTAMKKVDRQLSGMAESRARATEAMDALMAAAPWGTSDGKTSFSPADLGGAVSSMARFGGIGADDPLLNFTGTQTVDPNSMFNFYDQQLGVTGQLPQVPDLQTQPGMIPQAPGSIPIRQGSPMFRLPQAPVDTPMPQSTPPPPPGEIAAKLLGPILAMFQAPFSGGGGQSRPTPPQIQIPPVAPSSITDYVTGQFLRR